MARKVGIGCQDFETIRKKNIFYVDKTKFIREWWEAEDEVTLITRPRRFGKTLNMNMVEKFFSIKYAKREELFQGLRIWEDEKYREIQGTYPVISLSFANVKEKDYQTTVQRICQVITDLYEDWRFLLNEDVLSPTEKNYFLHISENMPEVTASIAIHRLSKFLYHYYGKKVIILLDEYDTPMQEAYANGYWDEMVSFARSMFNATFKTNPYLERAMMTGITRVSKESIFSDLNNLKVITTTSEKYMDNFGFTEEEVFDALDEFSLTERKGEVKRWYDGFTFGSRKDIYNPWSVINYLSTGKLECYWANSSSNSLVGKLIREGNKETKQNIERLISGETLRMEMDEQIIYNQLNKKRNSVWSLFLASGYLKTVNVEFIEQTGRRYYELALTNKEVRIMFEDMIRDWFAEEEGNYNAFIKAFLQNDLKAMNIYMNKVAMTTFSYFDTGKKPSEEEPERFHGVEATTKGLKEPNPSVCFYHGFVLGMMVELSDRYVLTSNRESGFGRYDVMLEPLYPEKDDGIIIEFKVLDKDEEKELSDTVEAALKQIEEKKYETALTAKGVPKEKIRKYGFAFSGKKVFIDSQRKKE